MPREVDFFDGQSSLVAPALGSLNRKVTGTRVSAIAVTAGGGITPVGRPIEMIFVVGSPGNVDVSVNPQIAAGGTTGEELNLVGTDDSKVVTLESGDGLLLNGTCDLDSETILNLLWDGSLWVEMSRF